jgi:hypothetical protein
MLNGGRLAKLASIMEQTVKEEEADGETITELGVPEGALAVEPDPVAPPKPTNWEATIIRGTAIETRSLKLKPETPNEDQPPTTVVND